MKMKKQKRKHYWTTAWYKRGDISSEMGLSKEQGDAAERDLKNYLRMDNDTFDLLPIKIAPIIQKQNTIYDLEEEAYVQKWRLEKEGHTYS